jgi:hypothetical protein
MKPARLAVAIASLVMVVSCVSASPAAQRVRVTTNPEVVAGCQFLGNVKAMSGWGAGGAIADNNLEETLKERTHKLGGNVLLISRTSGDVWSGTSRGTGEAFLCGSSTPQ